ncbi:MAG: hypothetical protein WCJ95_11520 [Mariniphaga sp.]
MQNLLSRIYLWTKRIAISRFSLLFIFLSFLLDSCVFPFPTTVIFVTVSLLHPARSYFNALIATLGMVGGSLIGYTIGHFLWLLPDGNFTQLALYFFHHTPGFTDQSYHYTQNLFVTWGYSILLLSIILPVPYQFYAISAGVFDFNLAAFLFSTLFFQGFRFFLFAWLIVRYGEEVKPIIEKNLRIIALICIAIILVMFILSTL